MARRFKMVDYEKAIEQTVTIRDVLPSDHLARFISGRLVAGEKSTRECQTAYLSTTWVLVGYDLVRMLVTEA